MSSPSEIELVLSDFERIKPCCCTVDLKADRPIYALVKIDSWPAAVHYEFRLNKSSGLFVELHVEHKKFSSLGTVLESFQRSSGEIGVHPIKYLAGVENPRQDQKRWPSLSIAVPNAASSMDAAKMMCELIEVTRSDISNALGNWSERRS